MDTNILSTGVRYSSSPESYDRRVSNSPNPPGFNSPAPDCKSNLDHKDLGTIRQKYKISEDICLMLPKYADNVCWVNEGETVLYEAALKAGLNLPLDPFIGELLRRLGLAPGQLVPNAWMIVVSWLDSWRKFVLESPELSVDKFLYCYQLRKAPRSSSHWSFFARYNDTKLEINLRSSNGTWKSKYFVVRGADLLESVNCSWGDPNKLDRPNLDKSHWHRLLSFLNFSRSDHNRSTNAEIQSQKKAKSSILGKRKASSYLSSQERSAQRVIAPVHNPPLPAVDGPSRPNKGKEVATTDTDTDTDDDSETVGSKQVHFEKNGTVDFRSLIRKLCHLVEECTKVLAQLSVISNEDLEKMTAIKNVVMKKVKCPEAAERAEG